MSEILAARDLKKVYRNGSNVLEVLKGIGLRVEKGESLSVAGVSGAGKSTLIHILGTLDAPTEGAVFWEKTSLSALTEEERDKFRKEKMGFIFQFYHLLPEFTALENVLLPALIRPRKKSCSEIRKKGMELLKEVGLAERADHKPARLSGGEQQRVAIARALVNEPEIIFADEPTGNLDRRNKEIIEIILFEKIHKKRGKTFILVTHEEALAQRAQRVLRLKDGLLTELTTRNQK